MSSSAQNIIQDSNQNENKGLCDPSLAIEQLVQEIQGVIQGQCKLKNINVDMRIREGGILDKDIIDKANEQQQNNIVIQEVESLQQQKKEEQISVSLTVKRDGIIHKVIQTIKEEEKQENASLSNDISINFQLQQKHIDQSELVTIMLCLKKKQMCLQNYISSGGEADVYLGYILDSKGNKIEAVFRIVKTGEALKMRQEYEKVIGIKHPRNLIEYEGLILIGENILVFIMKKFENNLKVKLHQNMSNEHFLQILLDLIHGLMELRIGNIIHLDIKPGNILVNHQGRCFYSDFGMAIKLKNRENLSYDKNGFTLSYCSPEHLGGNPVSYKSDIYSLGILLNQLSDNLTDKVFQNNIQKMVKAKMEQEDPDKRILPEELLQTFVEIIPKDLFIILLGYFFELRKNQSFFKEFDDIQGNVVANNKIKLTYKLIEFTVYKSFQEANEENLNLYKLQDFADLDLVLLFELVGLHPLNSQQLVYLEQIIDIMKSKPPSEELNVLWTRVELFFAYNYFGNENHKDAMIHYEAALKMLQENRKQNLEAISDIYHQQGICNLFLKNAQSGIDTLKKSIEERKLFTDRINIETFYFLGTFYDLNKDNVKSIEVWKQIKDDWNKHKEEYSKGVIGKRKNILRCIISSLFKLGEYVESYHLELRRLKLTDSLQEDLKDQVKLETLIKKFTPEQRQSAIEDLLKDKSNDLIKKIVLLEFAEYYLLVTFKKEQILHEIIATCTSIKDEMPIEKQIQEKVLLSKYYQSNQNTRNATKYIKEAIRFMRKPHHIIGYKLNTYQLNIFNIVVEQSLQKQEGSFESKYLSKDYQTKLLNLHAKQSELFTKMTLQSTQNVSIAVTECYQTLLLEEDLISLQSLEQNKKN